jgi:ubiquinone biosynthesis protein COQ9
MDIASARDGILIAALPHVAFDGWSRRTLRAAAVDAGYDPTMGQRLFPSGAVEMVEHFNDLADRRMAEALADMGLPALKLRQRVSLAVRMRLEPWSDEREAVRRAVALLALPQNAATGARITYRTVDAIWHAVGDTSTDFSFYTKRASLGAIYTATVLYWLDDPSEGARESWGFLERGLDQLMRLPKVTGALKRPFELAASPFRLFRPSGRRRFGHGPG